MNAALALSLQQASIRRFAKINAISIEMAAAIREAQADRRQFTPLGLFYVNG